MPPFQDLFLRINDFARQTPALQAPVAAYAKYGVLVFALLMVAAWWIARSRSTQMVARALLAPVATLGAVALQQLLDFGVGEPRPYAVFPHALVLVGRSADPSFPSDHACAAGAAAAALFFVDRRIGAIAAAGALLMAAARVYSGAHWPLDVVAGLAFGALVATGVVLLLTRPMTALVNAVADSRLRTLVARTARP